MDDVRDTGLPMQDASAECGAENFSTAAVAELDWPAPRVCDATDIAEDTDVNPREEASVDVDSPDNPPLLTIAGIEADHVAQAAMEISDGTAAEFSSQQAAGEISLGRIVEALLFGSDAPLSAGKLAEIAGASTPTAVRLEIAALNEKYALAGLTFRIEELAGGYRLLTLPAYQPWLQKLHKTVEQTRLTDAGLETLSIIAYKQPIIRADIEAIRGVACGDVLNRLRDMGLVKIVGRAEIVGRPLLYGTTRKFLDVFGLADLNDLPPMEALSLSRGAGTNGTAVPPLVRSAVAGS